MAQSLYNTARNAFASGAINWPNDGTSGYLYVAAVSSAYTPNFTTDQHKSAFSSAILGAPVALSGCTVSGGGKCFASNTALAAIASGSTIQALVVYRDPGTGDSNTQAIAYLDGNFTVTVAVAANSGATSIQVDPLLYPIASGTAIVFGSVTATLTAAATAGSRTLSVSALSGNIAQGTTGTAAASGTGEPYATNGNAININFDQVNGIFSI
jgi:hypothetical protein